MSARRLLILCYFYPPLAGGGVHRVLGFTRHLPDHGWSCTVVCAGPEDYWVTDTTLLDRVRPDTEVVRVPGGSALAAWLRARPRDRGRRPSGAFARLRRLADWWLVPDPYVGWAGRARGVARRLLARGGFDAVLTSSPPDSVHLAAPRPRRFGVPWVADFRDPWMGLYFRTPPTAAHRARQAALERRVLEEADLVLVASRSHEERIGAGSGAKPRRVLHLPNGFEPDESSAAAPAPAPSAERFELVFTGTLALMPDVEVFLEALHDLLARRPEARRRIRVRLAGPFETGYHDRAISLGLAPGIVEFTGPVAHAESRALQRAAAALLLWKPRGAPAMVPGKLYEYLDAGRPLVALLEPHDEAAELVARAGGDVVPPGDRFALADVLERRYLEWKERGPVPSRRSDWLEDHTRARLAGRLARALDAQVSPDRSRARGLVNPPA
jgi:glycosyltransferase involved in cell wall biosynthesis